MFARIMNTARIVVLALVAATGITLAASSAALADDCPGYGPVYYSNNNPYGQENARRICWEYISQHYATLPDEATWRKDEACRGGIRGRCTPTPYHWNRFGVWKPGESPATGRMTAPAPRAEPKAKPAPRKVVAPAATCSPAAPAAAAPRAPRGGEYTVRVPVLPN